MKTTGAQYDRSRERGIFVGPNNMLFRVCLVGNQSVSMVKNQHGSLVCEKMQQPGLGTLITTQNYFTKTF